MRQSSRETCLGRFPDEPQPLRDCRFRRTRREIKREGSRQPAAETGRHLSRCPRGCDVLVNTNRPRYASLELLRSRRRGAGQSHPPPFEFRRDRMARQLIGDRLAAGLFQGGLDSRGTPERRLIRPSRTLGAERTVVLYLVKGKKIRGRRGGWDSPLVEEVVCERRAHCIESRGRNHRCGKWRWMCWGAPTTDVDIRKLLDARDHGPFGSCGPSVAQCVHPTPMSRTKVVRRRPASVLFGSYWWSNGG